jgi:hypothetical protein
MIQVEYSSNHLAYLVYRYDINGLNERYFWDADGSPMKVEEGIEAPYWLMLDPSDAQELVDKLSKADIRPPEHNYIEGELKATKLHLEDMRQLALITPPKEPEE